MTFPPGGWITEAATLQRERSPFVLATVVARQAPQSSHPGAGALVLPDGTIRGWVGGGCVRPTVVREALTALREGRPRLIRLDPEAIEDRRPGVYVLPMTCKGEGAVDIFLEPIVPAPSLIILGRSPVAETLARLAEPLDLDVELLDAPATAGPSEEEQPAALRGLGGRDYVVVATMGAGDEEALEAAARSDAGYVGMVASPRKGGALFEYLRSRNVPTDRIERVRCPAGLDLGPGDPAEIAVSILAEIVRLRRQTGEAPGQRPGEELVDSGPVALESATRAAAKPAALPILPDAPDQRAAATEGGSEPVTSPVATDPICGMAVEIAGARHTSVHEGRTYYFCCPHCKAAFEKEPAAYAG